VNDLEAAEGYLQLQMAEEALVELRNLPHHEQQGERYKELLLATQMMLKHWQPAAETAKQLCEINSTESSYFIHAAFCLHETGDTISALIHLQSGPKTLLSDPLYHYNIACYHCVLGNLSEAKEFLEKSFQLDPSLKLTAVTDKDLTRLQPI